MTNVLIDDEVFVDEAKGQKRRTRIGEDGGQVMVEETGADGRAVTREATEREVAAYERALKASEFDAAKASIATGTPTLAEVVAYLRQRDGLA